jgi:Ca2+-binding EF-hand superfamily protein
MTKSGRGLSIAGAAFVTVLLLTNAALAITDSEIDAAFKMFDEDKDGKVTRAEYAVFKVRIIYRNVQTDPIAGVEFSQTRVSRQFFDSADGNRDGKLSVIEIIDALPFEKVAVAPNDFFVYEDLQRFMRAISP